MNFLTEAIGWGPPLPGYEKGENYFRSDEVPPTFTRAKEIIEGAGLEFKGMPLWLVENSPSESLAKIKSQKTITKEDLMAFAVLQNKGYFPAPGSGPKFSDMVKESESEASSGIVRDTVVPGARAIGESAMGGAALGPVGAIGAPILSPIIEDLAAPPITGQDGTMYMGDGTPAGAAGPHPSYWSDEDLINQAKISGGTNQEVMEEIQRRNEREKFQGRTYNSSAPMEDISPSRKELEDKYQRMMSGQALINNITGTPPAP